jgi:GNAT superfamily N-acetyltransferase
MPPPPPRPGRSAAPPVVRPGRPGDGPGCARVWLDTARHYVELDPASFQLPAEDGLADWFDRLHAAPPPDACRLVAELDGEVVGLAGATLLPPSDSARYQLLRGLSRPRVSVGALAVAATNRRAGVGSALLAAVEEWAAAAGASELSLDTYHASSLSIPFYDNRPGWSRHGVVYRKALERTQS